MKSNMDYHLGVVIEKNGTMTGKSASTYIREVLNAGDIPAGKTLLGYPYRVIVCAARENDVQNTGIFPTLK